MQFPINFKVSAKAKKGISSYWNSKSDETSDEINCCIPKEFGGPGKAYSPEDFFALAVLNCIIATFVVYAEHANLSFNEFDSDAVAIMEKHSDNYLFISHLKIRINITESSNKEKIKALLDKAIKDCAISNSVKCGKTYDINIS
jgi:uncharacterized OsmC-like protein